MPLAEKGVGKGRQPLSPPQHTVARSANSAPKWLSQHSAVSAYGPRPLDSVSWITCVGSSAKGVFA